MASNDKNKVSISAIMAEIRKHPTLVALFKRVGLSLESDEEGSKDYGILSTRKIEELRRKVSAISPLSSEEKSVRREAYEFLAGKIAQGTRFDDAFEEMKERYGESLLREIGVEVEIIATHQRGKIIGSAYGLHKVAIAGSDRVAYYYPGEIRFLDNEGSDNT